MRSERIRNFLFVSSHLWWFIDKLLAAFITPDRETVFQSRQGHFAICFTQRDSMAFKEVPPKMKPIIFAKDYPAVIAGFQHSDLLEPNALMG
jgi:hypothetical protein